MQEKRSYLTYTKLLSIFLFEWFFEIEVEGNRNPELDSLSLHLGRTKVNETDFLFYPFEENRVPLFYYLMGTIFSLLIYQNLDYNSSLLFSYFCENGITNSLPHFFHI
ncbi:MAG: hypothetical protein AAF824_17715 [Bacteroidota bacterium]